MDDFDPFNDPTLYEYQPIPWQKQLKKLFRRMDLYALPITFRYKAEKKFYTNFGAATSIVLLIVMVGFLWAYINEMLSDTRVTQQEVKKLAINKGIESNATFYFGFQVQDSEGELFDWTDSRVITPSITTETKKWDTETDDWAPSRPYNYPILPCKDVIMQKDIENSFDLSGQDFVRAGLGEFHCPVGLLPKFIGGQPYSESYTFTSIKINLCDVENERTDCLFRDMEQLMEFTSQLRIKFFFMNTNFDGSDISKPLHGFFDLSLTMKLGTELKQVTTVDLEENVAILEDSYYGIESWSQQLKFYQIGRITPTEFPNKKDKLNSLEVRLNQNISYVLYKRTKYNLLGVLSEIGGIFNSFYLIGFAFTLLFSYNLMMSSLIRSMYFFRAKFPSELKKDKKGKKKGGDSDQQQDRANDYKSLSLDEQFQAFENQGIARESLARYARQEQDNKSGKAEMLQQMQDNIGGSKKKANFNHKTIGVIKDYLCFRFLRSNNHLRKQARTRNSLYFRKGLLKLDKEADIGFIIRHIRILRYFLKTVLDKDQLALLKLKSKSFIPSEDEKPPSNTHKKKFKEDGLMETYVENLQRKTLGKQDVRLLEVLGFGKVLDVLNRYKAQEEAAKRVDSAQKTGNISSDYFALNNSIEKKSNPMAEEFRKEWHQALDRKSSQIALGFTPFNQEATSTYQRANKRVHREAVKQKSNATLNQEENALSESFEGSSESDYFGEEQIDTKFNFRTSIIRQNTGGRRQPDRSKRLSVTFKDSQVNQNQSKVGGTKSQHKPTQVAQERQEPTQKTHMQQPSNITLNRDRKFSFTYNTRIEGGNGDYGDQDEGQDQSLQSLMDKSGNNSRLENEAFEPFEINVYHKTRRTAQEILDESLENSMTQPGRKLKPKIYKNK